MAIATVEAPAALQNRNLYLSDREVMVELPPSCSTGITINPETGKVSIDPFVRTHLKAIMDDPILKGRYPTALDGEEYMNGVSGQWRDRLLEYTESVTEEIKRGCWSAGRNRFAVVLYGSLASNLAKHRTHEDPSNMDLVVIGEFSNWEKNQVLDRIRYVRQQTTTEIKAAELCRCGSIRCQCYNELVHRYWYYATADLRNRYGEMNGSHSGLVERAGVVIQTLETVRSNGYCEARKYLSSCARALYDPENLWGEIENEALMYLYLPPLTKRRFREGKPVDRILSNITATFADSPRFQQDPQVIDRVIHTLRQDSRSFGDHR